MPTLCTILSTRMEQRNHEYSLVCQQWLNWFLSQISNIGLVIRDSAYAAVVSAAQRLAKEHFVDRKHMGLQGHSFGGFETNYIVSHTSLFAAAGSAAGLGNLTSYYGQSPGFSGIK